jgi:tetratricopeptide (TPR) repeat protein
VVTTKNKKTGYVTLEKENGSGIEEHINNNLFLNESNEKQESILESKRVSIQNSTMEYKNEAEKFYALGYEARKKGDHNTAILCYTKAIDKNNQYFKAYFNRGFVFDKIGEYNKAIADYSKALEIEPKNAFVYYNRGISLDKMQMYDEAIYNFSMAITLEPSKADFYHNRGFAFRKKLEYEKAIQDYSKAIELNPQHFKVRKLFFTCRLIITRLHALTKWENTLKQNKLIKIH